MDLAVRASLKGWKFVYVGDLKVLLDDGVSSISPFALCSCFTFPSFPEASFTFYIKASCRRERVEFSLGNLNLSTL